MADQHHSAVIWDVDGTLVETAELHFQAWARLARERGWPFTRADFAATFGWRNPEIIPKLFGTHHTKRDIAELGERKEEYYRAVARDGIELLPGVRPLLEGLHTAGINQAIGSSAPRANLDLILGLTRTAHFFDAVVSIEDTQRGNPYPSVQVSSIPGRLPGARPYRLPSATSAGRTCWCGSGTGHVPVPRPAE
jgi:beta-phosphoglucomutase